MIDSTWSLAGIKGAFRKDGSHYPKTFGAIGHMVLATNFEGFQSRNKDIAEAILTSAEDLKAVVGHGRVGDMDLCRS